MLHKHLNKPSHAGVGRRASRSFAARVRSCVAWVGWVCGLSFSTTVVAQTLEPLPASNSNSSIPYVSERTLGLYQNDYQKRLLRTYPNYDPRAYRPVGLQPFARSGDGAGRTRNAVGSLPVFRSSAMRRGRLTNPAFAQYGGFGKRTASALTGTAAGAFRRRVELISALALNAPIRRARETVGTAFVPGITGTARFEGPLVRPAVAPDDSSELALAQHLREWGLAAGERARTEGWRLFGEGRFRQAARAFSQAMSVEPGDMESRIGELFCYVSVRALRTSIAVMEEWERQDANPFLHKLDMTSAFEDPRIAFDLKVELRLVATSEDVSPDVEALYTIVLWYLDDFDEAMRVATRLARHSSSETYASRPAKMRRALDVMRKGLH